MKYKLLSAVAALATVTATPVIAQTYSGGTGTFTGLGADQNAFPGTPFDTVDLTPITGTYTGPGTYNLNGVTFIVGINSINGGTFSGALTGLTGSFGGNAFTYSVNYTINIATADTITLGGNSFQVGAQTVRINPLTLNSGADPVSGTLSVSVPEPATWAMMLLGFGMVGFGLRSRRAGKVTTRASFA